MVDSLRSGGFSYPGLTFGSRSTGFSQYRIGDDSAADLAYLDKLTAQTAWQNGQISDDAYLAALRTYVNALEEGTSQRVSAENQLHDAIWSIGRNKLVHGVNDAATHNQRIAALTKLLNYDRRWRKTMVGNNEQAREMEARISDLEAQIRAARWAKIVERYNRDEISDARMQAFAERLARAARGEPDAQTYREQAEAFANRILDDELQDAIDDWEQSDRNAPNKAKRVEQLYRERMARMDPSSPAWERYDEARKSFRERVKAREDAHEYEIMKSRHDLGRISDAEWLDYMRKRASEAKPGSTERTQWRTAVIQETYRLSRQELEEGLVKGTHTPSDLIDFYQSSLALMDLGSSQASSILQRIEELRAYAMEPIGIGDNLTGAQDFGSLGGHYVMPSTPVSVQEGFISQHDGSAFARTNCGMAATAMLLWDVTGGEVRVSGGDLRYYSGDREGGTWTDDIVRAAAAVGIGARAYHGMSLATFRKRIRSGMPAVLQGTNAQLPPGMRFGYDGDHSVYVARVEVTSDGRVMYWVMDPNGRGDGYRGAWWPEEVLFSFGWQGHYSGSVVFAGKSGQAVVSAPDRLPPIQTHSTDYAGRSTIGRGGGISRQQAGSKKDWSQGKAKGDAKADKYAKDDLEVKVGTFLDLVDEMESESHTITFRDQMHDPSAYTAARRKRARQVLRRNDNDPRLAIVEWFTAETPSRDPSTWSKTERWYANAAARKFELGRIDKKTVLQTEAEAAAPAPDGAQGETSGEEPIVTGLDPDLEALSRGILKRLKVPPSAENIRMIAGWIRGESGDKVEGNNPFNLRTAGPEDLEGQYGRADDGRALFDSIDAGLDAAAEEIRAMAPEVVGALRSTDAEAFVRALERSRWTDDPARYAAGVTYNLNQLPGGRTIIARTGANPYSQPTSLADLARTTPELAELMDVDPNDPQQWKWFEGNMERAIAAAERGDETWEFRLPGVPTGQGLQVPSSPEVGKGIARVNLDYTIERTPPGASWQEDVDKAYQDYLAVSTDIDVETFKRWNDSATKAHDWALAAGDFTTAYNIELQRVRAINGLLGTGPDDTPDIRNAPAWMDDSDVSYLTGVIEAAVPRSIDPQRPEEYAPNGSPLLAAERDGLLVADFDVGMFNGTRLSDGLASRVTAAPDSHFSERRTDGSFAHYWANTHPDLFDPVTEVDFNTGERVVIPRYKSRQYSGRIPITQDGLRTYQTVEVVDTPFVEMWAMDYTARSRANEAYRQQPKRPAGIGAYAAGADDLLAQLEQGPDGPVRVSGPVVPRDGILQRQGVMDPGGQVPVYRMTTYDSASRETITWLSIDQTTWIGYAGDGLGKSPPGLVAMGGASWRTHPDTDEAPTLVINDDPYDRQKHGPIGQYLGWYGTVDLPGVQQQGIGGPNSTYFVRQGQFIVEDGVFVDYAPDLTLSPGERWRAGGIGLGEALGLEGVLADNLEEMAANVQGWLTQQLPQANEPIPNVPSSAMLKRMETINAPPGGINGWSQMAEAAQSGRAGQLRTLAQEQAAVAEAQAALEARVAQEQQAAEARRQLASIRQADTAARLAGRDEPAVPAPQRKPTPTPTPPAPQSPAPRSPAPPVPRAPKYPGSSRTPQPTPVPTPKPKYDPNETIGGSYKPKTPEGPGVPQGRQPRGGR